MKKLAAFMIALCLLLCGCAKEDNRILVPKASAGEDPVVLGTMPREGMEPGRLEYSGKITSRDGTLELDIQIDQEVPGMILPVTEAAPCFLTGEKARQIAELLLPGTEFYDASLADEDRPQELLQSRLDLLESIHSQEALRELYGYDWDQSIALRELETSINYLKQAIEISSREPRQKQTWELKVPDWRDQSMPDSLSPKWIQASATMAEGEYYFSFVSQNAPEWNDRAMHMCRVEMEVYGQLERMIHRARLCRTEKPTQAQLDGLKDRAQQLLDEMDLGVWQITDCTLRTHSQGKALEYYAEVTALPVFHDMEAPADLFKNSEGELRPSLVNMELAPGGQVLSFRMTSPVAPVEENQASLPLDQVMKMGLDQLGGYSALDDLGVYPGTCQAKQRKTGQQMTCKAEITGIRLCMRRIPVPNTTDRYYFIPALALMGSTDYYRADTGERVFGSGDYRDRIQPLVWVNTADGTILP